MKSTFGVAAVARAGEGSAALLMPKDLLDVGEHTFEQEYPDIAGCQLYGEVLCLEFGSLAVAAAEQAVSQEYSIIEQLGRLGLAGQSLGDDVPRAVNGYPLSRPEAVAPIAQERQVYVNWGTADYVNYARQAKNYLGRLPSMADYKQLFTQGIGPSYNLIIKHGGGIKSLHANLGFPDTEFWDRSDYVDWGVKVRTANPGKTFDTKIVMALAADKRGPTRRTIYRNCGKWESFYTDVDNEFQARPIARLHERDAKLSHYQSMAKQGVIPLDALALSKDRLLEVGARYLVVEDCASDLNIKTKRLLSRSRSTNFIGHLRQERPMLTPGHIEMVAESHNVFDDIWPQLETEENYRISQAKIDSLSLAYNLRQVQLYAKRAGLRA